MKKVWKSYKQTIILLGALVIGAIVGIIFKEKANVLSPLGDLFLNMMFVIIVPLIFLTITTSIAKIKHPKRLSKVLITIFTVFIITSFISCVVGLISTYSTKLVKTEDSTKIMETLSTDEENEKEDLNLLERTVSLISTNDFTGVLSRNNIVAIVIFSLLIGISINKVGEKAKPLLSILEAANSVVLKFVDIAFLYAPIGLGCYFAALIGNFGTAIAFGYLKTFLVYLVVAIVFYFAMYSLYAFIAGGKEGFRRFWKNAITPSLTAISTCSSAACIPINVKSAKEIGVSSDIAETTIPLGTSFHKDGSIIGSVFKIMFLAYLFGTNVTSFSGIMQVVVVALLANLLITAVPIGGGTISEMLILSMMSYPVAALPILTIVATIIDAPATMLNSVGDISSSMLVARIVDGKKWLNEKKSSV